MSVFVCVVPFALEALQTNVSETNPKCLAVRVVDAASSKALLPEVICHTKFPVVVRSEKKQLKLGSSLKINAGGTNPRDGPTLYFPNAAEASVVDVLHKTSPATVTVPEPAVAVETLVPVFPGTSGILILSTPPP